MEGVKELRKVQGPLEVASGTDCQIESAVLFMRFVLKWIFVNGSSLQKKKTTLLCVSVHKAMEMFTSPSMLPHTCCLDKEAAIRLLKAGVFSTGTHTHT